MCLFNKCDYTIFLNEQIRFSDLLKICKEIDSDINSEKIIIYTRFKYATLLFSKLFNFEINFSFIYSKFYNKYYKQDLQDFSEGKTKILLTDKLLDEYLEIPNLNKIICYDIDNDCIKFFNKKSTLDLNLSLLLLNDNNNTILNSLIKEDIMPITKLDTNSQQFIEI